MRVLSLDELAAWCRVFPYSIFDSEAYWRVDQYTSSQISKNYTHFVQCETKLGFLIVPWDHTYFLNLFDAAICRRHVAIYASIPLSMSLPGIRCVSHRERDGAQRDDGSQTRSLRIDDHCTLIWLELSFWDTLEEIAAKEGMTLAKFLATLSPRCMDAAE